MSMLDATDLLSNGNLMDERELFDSVSINFSEV